MPVDRGELSALRAAIAAMTEDEKTTFLEETDSIQESIEGIAERLPPILDQINTVEQETEILNQKRTTLEQQQSTIQAERETIQSELQAVNDEVHTIVEELQQQQQPHVMEEPSPFLLQSLASVAVFKGTLTKELQKETKQHDAISKQLYCVLELEAALRRKTQKLLLQYNQLLKQQQSYRELANTKKDWFLAKHYHSNSNNQHEEEC